MDNALITGIVGIVGTLSGIIVERAVRKMGRVSMTSPGITITYTKRNTGGGGIPCPPNEAAVADYSVTLDMFNGKEEPTAMHEFLIEFVRGGRVIGSDVPHDRTTTRATEHLIRSSELSPLNIPPKQIIQLRLFGRINGDVRALPHATAAVFRWKSARGDKQRHTLKIIPPTKEK